MLVKLSLDRPAIADCLSVEPGDASANAFFVVLFFGLAAINPYSLVAPLGHAST